MTATLVSHHVCMASRQPHSRLSRTITESIELAFAKLKTFCRAARPRSFE